MNTDQNRSGQCDGELDKQELINIF